MEGCREPKSKYQTYKPDPLKYIIHGHNSRLPRLSRLPMLNIVRLLMSLCIAVQLLWLETDPRLPRLPMLNMVMLLMS